MADNLKTVRTIIGKRSSQDLLDDDSTLSCDYCAGYDSALDYVEHLLNIPIDILDSSNVKEQFRALLEAFETYLGVEDLYDERRDNLLETIKMIKSELG